MVPSVISLTVMGERLTVGVVGGVVLYWRYTSTCGQKVFGGRSFIRSDHKGIDLEENIYYGISSILFGISD